MTKRPVWEKQTLLFHEAVAEKMGLSVEEFIRKTNELAGASPEQDAQSLANYKEAKAYWVDGNDG